METESRIEFTVESRNIKVASKYNSKFKMQSKSNLMMLWLASALLITIAFDYRNHSMAYSILLASFLLVTFHLTFTRFFYNPIIVAINQKYIGTIVKMQISDGHFHIDNERYSVSFKLEYLSILNDDSAYCIFFERPILIIPNINTNSEMLEFMHRLQQKCGKSGTSTDR